MDYDFFDEQKKEEITEEKSEGKQDQRVPTPSVWVGNGTEVPAEKVKKPKLWLTFLSIGLALITFLAGYLVCWLTLDEEMRTLVKVKQRIEDSYYKEVTDEEFYGAIFGGINEKILDDYSEYMTPEEFAAYTADLEGSRVGIGLVFEANSLTVVRVCGNSPAEKAGILAGEKITACGDNDETLLPCATFDEFSEKLAEYGEGEEFSLQLSSGAETRVLRLSKQEYVENLVFYQTKEKSYAFEGDEDSTMKEYGVPLSYLDDETAYIRLIGFTGNAAEEFAKSMSKFKEEGKKNLILDLRGNGGGLLETMQSIASYFCKNTTEKEPVAAVADYGNRTVRYRAEKNVYREYFAENSRICVLADSGSASASECLIGCMLDYGAIGFEDICLIERSGVAKTYGKGIMQETLFVNLLAGDALKLTTAEIRWPVSNRSIHDRGVLPEDGAIVSQANADFGAETKAAIEALLSNR